jgi:glycosyltransferase involved in cell wall biosynthesis
LADELAAAEGAGLVAIPMQRRIAPAADLAAFLRLLRVLRRLRPNLTEFSTPKAGLLGNVAALLCSVPTRVYMLRGLRLETAQGLKRIVLKVAERIAAACAHTVVCNSESLRERARVLGVARESKLHLVGDGSSNGVDMARFAPGADAMRAQLGIAPDAPVVGFVGRLTRDKGVPELVEAFDRLLESLPGARLLLVGWYDRSEDALSPEWRARIDAHSGIVHTGIVQDTAPYYRAMDVLALPTWREGFPNVALEAAASGIPVIATLTTGARDAVLDEITGLLISPGNVEVLTESMLALLKDDCKRAAMGHAARRWVEKSFNQSRVLGETTAFYRQLMLEAEGRPVEVAADTV